MTNSTTERRSRNLAANFLLELTLNALLEKIDDPLTCRTVISKQESSVIGLRPTTIIFAHCWGDFEMKSSNVQNYRSCPDNGCTSNTWNRRRIHLTVFGGWRRTTRNITHVHADDANWLFWGPFTYATATRNPIENVPYTHIPVRSHHYRSIHTRVRHKDLRMKRACNRFNVGGN